MTRTRSQKPQPVIPTGQLIHLEVQQLRPSAHNPRRLFDADPLRVLKASIRDHGVLVPLTVYKLPGQKIYAIVDGERRYRCCQELTREGLDIRIPANIVAAPDTTASLVYMFNIHQFREQWELMPTAIALKSLIDVLKSDDDQQLAELTGLKDRQIERCKIILSFPEKYQALSMEADKKHRVPSNFWVELFPVLRLAEKLLPELIEETGRDGITDRMVEKYRNKRIRSVIHFRRILEANDAQGDEEGVDEVREKLREYILDPDLETRAAFDGFIADSRSRQKASDAMARFINQLKRAKIEHVTEGREALIEKLTKVREFIERLLARLEGGDPPPDQEEGA